MVSTWAKSRNFGAILWVLCLQYYVVQVIVASSWRLHGYSWPHNTISDLGNTQCELYRNGLVCSPLHALMNVSFIVLGMTMIGGALLLRCRTYIHREPLGSIGYYCMAAAGVGSILVGTFPENTVSGLHILGAALSFLLGNLGMLAVSISVCKMPLWLRLYGCISGLVGLVALTSFVRHAYLGLGIGGLERAVSYPQSIWMIVFGIYLLVASVDYSAAWSES